VPVPGGEQKKLLWVIGETGRPACRPFPVPNALEPHGCKRRSAQQPDQVACGGPRPIDVLVQERKSKVPNCCRLALPCGAGPAGGGPSAAGLEDLVELCNGSTVVLYDFRRLLGAGGAGQRGFRAGRRLEGPACGLRRVQQPQTMPWAGRLDPPCSAIRSVRTLEPIWSGSRRRGRPQPPGFRSRARLKRPCLSLLRARAAPAAGSGPLNGIDAHWNPAILLDQALLCAHYRCGDCGLDQVGAAKAGLA